MSNATENATVAATQTTDSQAETQSSTENRQRAKAVNREDILRAVLKGAKEDKTHGEVAAELFPDKEPAKASQHLSSRLSVYRRELALIPFAEKTLSKKAFNAAKAVAEKDDKPHALVRALAAALQKAKKPFEMSDIPDEYKAGIPTLRNPGRAGTGSQESTADLVSRLAAELG